MDVANEVNDIGDLIGNSGTRATLYASASHEDDHVSNFWLRSRDSRLHIYYYRADTSNSSVKPLLCPQISQICQICFKCRLQP